MTSPELSFDPAFGSPSARGMPLSVRPVPISSLTLSELLIGGPLRLYGWAFWETTGSASARIKLWSGGTNGQLLAPIQLNASESTRDWLSPLYVPCNGLYKEAVTGSVDGVVYVIPE